MKSGENGRQKKRQLPEKSRGLSVHTDTLLSLEEISVTFLVPDVPRSHNAGVTDDLVNDPQHDAHPDIRPSTVEGDS